MSDTEKKMHDKIEGTVKKTHSKRDTSESTMREAGAAPKKRRPVSADGKRPEGSARKRPSTATSGTKRPEGERAKRPVSADGTPVKKTTASTKKRRPVATGEQRIPMTDAERAEIAKRRRAKKLAEERAMREQAAKEQAAKVQESHPVVEIEQEVEQLEEKKSLKKKILKVIGIILGILVLIYVAFALYFQSHFMFQTSVNGITVSGKSVKKVNTLMEEHVKDYVLTLQESDGDTEAIAGKDISAVYIADDEQLQELVKQQKNFLWITSLWEKQELEAQMGVEYNESSLASKIEALACMQEENQKKSVNAHPEFKDIQFVVVEEVIGTEIDEDVFNQAVREAVSTCQDTLNLEEKECYIKPKFLSDSEKVAKAAEKMNSYLGAKITYDFSPNTEVVDSAQIAEWVKCNNKMKVTFDKDAVKEYIEELAKKYNTLGESRKFKTARGDTVTVQGGYYGWKINQDAEYEQLIKDIKSGKEVEREPEYTMRGESHGDSDVGDTYAEVDLTNQHMYFTKNGKVVLDSPIVTGNPNKGNATPQGTYSLTYKTKNATLRGEKKPNGEYSYETPVAYWMPFNGGIGFHDATWQSSFGGTRYKTNGSHGCINMPKEKAAKLYDLIEQGMPVICYY